MDNQVLLGGGSDDQALLGAPTPEQQAQQVAANMAAALQSQNVDFTSGRLLQAPTPEQQAQQVAANMASALRSQNAALTQQDAENTGTPAGYNLGPPYTASPTDYSGTPLTAPDQTQYGPNALPNNWQTFQNKDISTGGGFFTLADLFASRHQPIPWAFQQGASMPSTNNYRLLAPNYRQPNFIMRNGEVIDLNSPSMTGPTGASPNEYGHGHYSSGAAAGFPAAYSIGHSNSTLGWPGSLGGWVSPIGQPLS